MKTSNLAKFFMTVFISGLVSTGAFASNSGVSYQGRILKPDGTPLSGVNTQFKMQIRTPDSQDCLMYEEMQSLNMSQSNGAFSITINDGSGSRTDTTGLTLDKIFANHGSFTLNTTTCASGTGVYAPNSSDGRNLVVLFKDETMATWEPIPAQKINFVPFAFESKQIAGFTSQSLVRVAEADGTLDIVSPLSNANYTELLALINGSTTQYSKAGQLGGVSLPTMSSGQVLGWNGTAWVSQDPVPAASITSTQLASGAVGTSQIANNVSIATTGTVASAITTTRDFKIFAASPSTFAIDMQAPALTASYSLVWPLTAGSNNQVLTTDGSGNLSWSTPSGGGSSQWTTNGTMIGYAGGNVGIGTTSPGFPLQVATDVPNVFNGSAIYLSNNMTSSTNSQYGLRSVQTVTPTSASSMGYTGVYGGVIPSSTANLTSAALVGVNGVIWSNLASGTVGAAAGVYGGIQNTSTGTIGNASGLRVAALVNAGTITNTYGLRIDTQTAGTQTNAPFALYQAGTSDTNYFAGNVGIGTASPSAKLTLAAGSASAGTAPLKFTSGPLLTTAEDGAMEYNSSTGLYFTIGATRYVIPTNTTAGNYSNVSSIGNSSGSITMTPMAGNSVIVNAATTSTSSSTGALIVNGGVGIAGAVNTGGNIVSGGSVTATTNMVTPQLYGSTAASGNIKIDGTSNATPGNVLLASAGGNVGIGTTSPGALLDVAGDAHINGVTVGRGASSIASNTALGAGAFASVTTASTSTAVGSGAGASLTTAQQATYLGYQAGYSNQTANSVVAVGYQALYNSTVGTMVAVGAGALQANTTGSLNTAIGHAALQLNTTGSGNTALGYLAGQNTTGSNNTVIGSNALKTNTTGSQNTAIGTQALISSTSANYNVGLGYYAGYTLTSGTGNIVIGSYPTNTSGLTTGNYNILLGYDIHPPSTTANSQLNIGNLIYATGLGTGTTASAGNVGIGTTAPTSKLQVSGGSLLIDNGQYFQAMRNGGSAVINVLGFDSGTDNLFLRTGGSNSGNRFGIVNTAGSEMLTIRNDGTVGIGTTTPSAALQVKAGGTAAGTAPLKFTSGGVKLATPEDGAMEYDGTNYYLTVGSSRTAIPLNWRHRFI